MTKWILALAAMALAWSPLHAQNDDMERADRIEVYFERSSSTLTPTGKNVVKMIVDRHKANDASLFYLAGHTDTLRLASINLTLSAAMANAVASYMIELGVPYTRISRAAFGESTPAVQTDDGVSEPRNRRVVINVYVPKRAEQ